MNVFRNLIGIVSLVLALNSAAPATAEDFPAQFPQVETVGSHHLVLNGYGERERWFLNVYGCALYAPRKTSSPEYLMTRSTPSAIRILVKVTPPSEPPDRWEETFQAHLANELFSRMTAVYEDLEAGDVLLFAYAPEDGTKAFLNGRLLFTDVGHGLMRGLLDQWLGPRPVSSNLRRLLLQ